MDQLDPRGPRTARWGLPVCPLAPDRDRTGSPRRRSPRRPDPRGLKWRLVGCRLAPRCIQLHSGRKWAVRRDPEGPQWVNSRPCPRDLPYRCQVRCGCLDNSLQCLANSPQCLDSSLPCQGNNLPCLVSSRQCLVSSRPCLDNKGPLSPDNSFRRRGSLQCLVKCLQCQGDRDRTSAKPINRCQARCHLLQGRADPLDPLALQDRNP